MTGDVRISHSIFSHNGYAGTHGGAVIHIGNQENPQIVFKIRNCNFTYNTGTTSVVYISQSSKQQSLGLVSFYDLVFSSNKGIAVHLNRQNLYMHGKFSFSQNVADNGAGMFISNSSNVYNKSSTVEFRENMATDTGGAIFLNNNSTILFGQKSEFISN